MWDDYNINIIDTPGHVDFTIEVERALRVLDGAILVLCSVRGRAVASRSPSTGRCSATSVPRIAFVNKMDRAGANYERVVATAQGEARATTRCMIQVPIGAEDKLRRASSTRSSMKAFYFDGENGENIREEDDPRRVRRRGQGSAARR